MLTGMFSPSKGREEEKEKNRVLLALIPKSISPPGATSKLLVGYAI
jgi:hypothetical protein